MRLSLFTLTGLTVGLLASFSNAYSDNEHEARDIEHFLEQREMLDALSTRELVEELSVRLDRRDKKGSASPKPVGLKKSHTCEYCKKYFKTAEMYRRRVGSVRRQRHCEGTRFGRCLAPPSTPNHGTPSFLPSPIFFLHNGPPSRLRPQISLQVTQTHIYDIDDPRADDDDNPQPNDNGAPHSSTHRRPLRAPERPLGARPPHPVPRLPSGLCGCARPRCGEGAWWYRCRAREKKLGRVLRWMWGMWRRRRRGRGRRGRRRLRIKKELEDVEMRKGEEEEAKGKADTANLAMPPQPSPLRTSSPLAQVLMEVDEAMDLAE
ncbi:hypothetical protein DFP72DRAFT_1079318 [Ephemerocybe angulata]|uniref:Uncharacterized protein n=1 Tax=Ephemerocybe angulata TaxID=980116 RepID=A0A8H6LWM2_9AGAR|nr:hypothetical protein DFP72DRAFT_1079318 [Tulosesus angulatus]